MLVGNREHASVMSENCRIFPKDQTEHWRTQQRGNAENLDYEMRKEQILSRDVKRTDFIQIKKSGKTKDFYKEKG